MSDLISRQAAIEALFDWEMTYDWDDHCREEDPKPAYIVSPSDVIEQLPSAQPEQKKGRWIEDKYMSDVDSCIYTRYICSSCGAIEYKKYSYCHCGAQMNESDDDH